jgi:hypothetical protein
MSGILDNKIRIIDALVTLAGRQQISTGDLRIEYVSFTDAGTYYAADVASGSADASSRIFLEACNLPQDQITLESDDEGRLMPFPNRLGIQIKDGQILDYSFQATTSSFFTGSLENTTFIKGNEFASTSKELLASSLDNFQKLQTIATRDRVFEDDGFGLGNTDITYTINNTRPIADPNRFVAHIDHIESLFNDVRLGHVKNFHYLPPVNKIVDMSIDKTDHRLTSQKKLGNYPPLGRTHLFPLTYEQIKFELKHYENLGYSRTIAIDPTSHNNHIVAQFFERNYNQLRKLDVIDFGKQRTGDPSAPIAHIFFVGKVMIDNNNTHTFVHIFTMIFE